MSSTSRTQADETVLGDRELTEHVEREKSEQGAVSVRLGLPVIDSEPVALYV